MLRHCIVYVSLVSGAGRDARLANYASLYGPCHHGERPLLDAGSHPSTLTAKRLSKAGAPVGSDRRRKVAALCVLDAGNHDIRTVICQPAHRLLANATCATSDDGHFAVKFV
ncbi:hypothetical protein NL676_028893 [Syzygium grande]|nr:hypothetical protein NL676_028893 [Syzygium grande]